MTGDQRFTDGKGNTGYEVKGMIIDKEDAGVTVEIRPSRTQSAIVKLENFKIDFAKRPHAGWNIGDVVTVRIFKPHEGN